MMIQFFNGTFPIGVVTVGTVVQRTGRPTDAEDGDKTEPLDVFGHVTGFARNTFNELLIVVKWESNERYPYNDGGYVQALHPSQLMIHV